MDFIQDKENILDNNKNILDDGFMGENKLKEHQLVVVQRLEPLTWTNHKIHTHRICLQKISENIKLNAATDVNTKNGNATEIHLGVNFLTFMLNDYGPNTLVQIKNRFFQFDRDIEYTQKKREKQESLKLLGNPINVKSKVLHFEFIHPDHWNLGVGNWIFD
jgi:hypothetical protein